MNRRKVRRSPNPATFSANAARRRADASALRHVHEMNADAGAILRMPIFWLALALFVATLAGCVVTIVLALGQPDDSLPGIGERLLKVPSSYSEVTW